MAKQPMARLITGVGDLMWVFITGNGKKNLQDKNCFVASVRFAKDDPKLAKIEAQLATFWEEHKGKGWKLKSTGVTPEKYPAGHAQEGEETGNVFVNFWTGVTWPDGKAKVIKTKNSAGLEVSLGSKKIGNGSRGAISGNMSLYDSGVAARGITLFLNTVQLTKFVEFTQDDGMGAVEDEDGEGFTGADIDDGMTAIVDEDYLPDGGAEAAKSAPKVEL